MDYLCETCVTRLSCKEYLSILNEVDGQKNGVGKVTIIYKCPLYLPDRQALKEE